MPRQTEALVNGFEQAVLEGLVVEADGGLERADEVADHILRRIVQERGETPGIIPISIERACDLLDEHRVLGNGEGVRAGRLAVPARDTGKSVCDILDGDVVGRWREQIETAAREHSLPGARPFVLSLRAAHFLGALNLRWRAAQGAYRWQSTR